MYRIGSLWHHIFPTETCKIKTMQLQKSDIREKTNKQKRHTHKVKLFKHIQNSKLIEKKMVFIYMFFPPFTNKITQMKTFLETKGPILFCSLSLFLFNGLLLVKFKKLLGCEIISSRINAALDGETEAVVSHYSILTGLMALYQTKRTLWGKVLCLQLDHWAWKLRESSVSWPTYTAISSSDAVNLLWSVEINCSVKTCSHYHSHLQHLPFQFTRTERIEAEILQTMWNCFFEMYLSRKNSWHLLDTFLKPGFYPMAVKKKQGRLSSGGYVLFHVTNCRRG